MLTLYDGAIITMANGNVFLLQTTMNVVPTMVGVSTFAPIQQALIPAPAGQATFYLTQMTNPVKTSMSAKATMVAVSRPASTSKAAIPAHAMVAMSFPLMANHVQVRTATF